MVIPMPPPTLRVRNGQRRHHHRSPPDVVDRPGRGEGGSAVVQPVIVGVRSDPRHPLSQPPYPPAIIREGNQGTVDIEVYVLPNGRVGDARIVKSTGFERLDRVGARRGEAQLAPAAGDARRRAVRAVAPPARGLQARIQQRLLRRRAGCRRRRSRPGSPGTGVAGTVLGAVTGAGGSSAAFAQPEEHAERGNGHQNPRPWDPFFSGSLIVLPTSNRLANLIALIP